MLCKKCRPLAVAVFAAAVCLSGFATVSVAADGDQAMPKFSEVEKTVLASFGKVQGYKPGDIISRGQVQPIFGQLDRLGWRVANQKAILAAVLPDNDQLVRQLRTPAGKKFARQVAKVPQGYDRLYRLSRLPRGRQNVQSLIAGPDGYLMLEYMTTTPEGKNLGRMLSRDPGGKGFNKPTRLLFTADMLIDELKRQYAIATGKAPAPQQPVPGQNPTPARR